MPKLMLHMEIDTWVQWNNLTIHIQNVRVRNSLWLDRLKQSLNESSWWVSEVDKVKAIIVLVPVIVLVLAI